MDFQNLPDGKRLKLLLFSLVFDLPVIFAASYCDIGYVKITPLLVLVSGVIMAGVSALYMFSRMTSDHKLQILVREEIMMILFVGLLAIAMKTFFAAACGIVNPSSGTNMYDNSLGFIKRIELNQVNTYSSLSGRSIANMADSGFYWNWGMIILGGWGQLSSDSLTKRVRHYYQDIALDLMVPAMISINIQRVFLELFSLEGEMSFVDIMLSCALFLKLVPGLREIGNALIGFTFCIVFLVPFLYSNYSDISTTVNEITLGTDQALVQARAGVEVNPSIRECTLVNDPDIPYEQIIRYFPEAFFLPNITIALMIIGVNAMMKGLRLVDRWAESVA